MRRLLLSGAACLLVSVSAAQAQIPVTDGGAIAQLIDQAKQGLQQIQLLQQQVQQVMSVYQAISGVRDLGSALSAASMLGLTDRLPINLYAVQSLLNGNGNISGMASSIGALFNSNSGDSHVYDPTGTGFSADLMRRRATSIAGIQGLAGDLYQAMAERLPLLQQLQARLSGAKDLQDVATVQAQISAQQTAIQAQQAQAQSLSMMQVAAYQSAQQQREEQRQKDIDAVISANPDR